MYQISGQLVGLAPFLYNRMVDPSVLDTGVSGAKDSSAAGRLSEAEQRVYRHPVSGALCLPRWNLKRMMLDGATKSKIKVSKLTLRELVSAHLFVEDDPLFNQSERSFIHEVVGKIPPRTGKAALIRRPALDTGWRLTFRLAVGDPVPPGPLRAALTLAGSLVGVGSWRPEFGRFMVEQWDVQGLPE